MKIELWKDIENYKGYYQVSDLGRIRSLSRSIDNKRGSFTKLKDRMLKQTIASMGRYIVNLNKNGKSNICLVHQLVAIAFLEHKKDGYKLVINHINMDGLDNRVENLEIVTQRENCSFIRDKCKSKYTGVSFNTGRNKWRAGIYINGKNKHLGLFKNEIDAHNKYQLELKKHISCN